jgi:hypothetical protein
MSVLAAAVAAFVIGFLWHGPLFGKQWMKMMGISQAEMEAAKAKGMGAMAPQMLAALVQHIVVAAVTAHLISALGLGDITSYIMLAFLLWLGFVATTLLNGVLWEKRKMELYVFNIVYQLVSLVAIAVIVGMWR